MWSSRLVQLLHPWKEEYLLRCLIHREAIVSTTTFIVGIVVIIIVYFFLKESSTKQKSLTKQKSPKRNRLQAAKAEDDNFDWLREIWKKADQEQEEGRLKIFPEWFYDEVTPRQIEKIDSLDVNVTGKLTKGKASDLIGLFNPIDDDDLAVLNFFKVQKKGMNQTKGRYKARELLSVPENQSQWDNRPASQVQKEFFRFFDIRVPTGLSSKDAQKIIDDKTRVESEQDDDNIKLDEWDSYEEIITELSDREMLRDDFEIKKPSLVLIREVVEILAKEGRSLTDLTAYDVAEKIQELKPNMARQPNEDDD